MRQSRWITFFLIINCGLFAHETNSVRSENREREGPAASYNYGYTVDANATGKDNITAHNHSIETTVCCFLQLSFSPLSVYDETRHERC
jgi:hypothetical protein